MLPKRSADTALYTAIMMEPQDANPMGNVHGGVIMKHIDTTAGAVATRHAGLHAVTASVDRLDFLRPVFVGDLVILQARLNLAGQTSMEVEVKVDAEDPRSGEVRPCVHAYLTFVALNREGRPAPVPELILETDEDRLRHQQATERREMRLAEKKRERENGISAKSKRN